MKTGMTFRSDEECWAWLDRRAKRRERLCKTARYSALAAAAALLLLAFLYFFARHMGRGRHDPWQSAINNARSPSG